MSRTKRATVYQSQYYPFTSMTISVAEIVGDNNEYQPGIFANDYCIYCSTETYLFVIHKDS